MNVKPYDLVVLGSGPAGEKGAAQAAYFGKSVALVEQSGLVGGASCNSGTLPSKTLRETALALSGFRSRDIFGVDLSVRRGTTVQDLLSRERRVTAAERAAVEENIRRHQIDSFWGTGSFVDPHTVRVEGPDGTEILRGDVILIATGSAPRRPEMFPFEDRRVWDSDEILNMDFMPGRLAVIGAGVIGCEYACIFAELGVEVMLVHSREEILDFLDRDICDVLQASMRALGMRLLTGERVTACVAKDDGVRVDLASGKGLDVDAVLVAAGRQSNMARLNLAAAGISTNSRGEITVNERFQTDVPHIYAAGDVVGFPALASVSMEQARLAMVDAFDLKYKKAAAPVLPLGVYTIPEVSCAGETEASLQARGVSYVAGYARYSDNARGRIIGDGTGMLKLLFDRESMQLLGVGVVGENASELVHVGLLALMVNAGHELFIETCFNYPTLGQLYKYATYDAMGRLANTDS